MRTLIIAFWVFIVIMLLWQFYQYNQSFTQAQAARPADAHYYFFPSNTAPVQAAPPPVSGANVEQLAYSVTQGKPAAGSMTAHVTLKNIGDAKAVDVQIWVRPYRGIIIGDPDYPTTKPHVLSDDDPLAQFGQWVSFPDLGPGETSSQDVVMSSRPRVDPGDNPRPQIVFQTAKSKP